MSVRHKKDTHMGSGAFITGAPGTSGSYFMPEPMGFQVTSKFGMALHVSCVHRSFVRIILCLAQSHSLMTRRGILGPIVRSWIF